MKGSRKHVLELIDNPNYISIMNNILVPFDIILEDKKTVQPKGFIDSSEYRLQRFVNEHKLVNIFPSLKGFNFNKWWNPHGGGAPTWDMISLCKLNGKDAILLVEAKAHTSEFDTYRKKKKVNPSDGTKANHINIEKRIKEACDSLNNTNKGFNVSINKHYQLSNRVAFSWKLNQLNIPVVLLYLGFTGDTYFKDFFIDNNHWEKEFKHYLEGVVPYDFLNSSLSEFLFIQSSLPI
jgi:hypothetical protein